MRTLIISTLGFVFMFLAQTVSAQDLVYKPRNPAFGGDTFNYNWLLSSAEAQNSTTDPNATDEEDESGLDDFTERLNQQTLNQISRQVFSRTIGEGELQEGQFTVGSLSLNIVEAAEGLVINILDTATGEQSQIVIPF